MKILHIDLSTGDIKEASIDEEIIKKFIGGRGLGLHIYSNIVHEEVDPLGEENPVVITTGPLVGLAPMSGRHCITTRSPLTGTIFDSTAGGYFGYEMRKTPYLAIAIHGRSERPVYIGVEDSRVEIHNAGDLWGLRTSEALKKLMASGGEAGVIGPAGENGVLYANVRFSQGHFSGRGGVGAVFGAKNLKGIVVRGTGEIVARDPEKMARGREEALRLIMASPVLMKGLARYGTPVLVNLMNYMKILPVRNFRAREFVEADKISGETFARIYEQKKAPCWGCPVGCNRISDDGREMPEYESVWAFGSDLGNSDINLIMDANTMANELGMDTISAGATMAADMEIKGIDVTAYDVLRTLEDIATGRSPLAMGSRQLAEKHGKPGIAMEVKGLELPAYDPRGTYGMALSYATSTRGGDHLRGYMVSPEILGKPKLINRLSFSGKAALVIIFQNLAAAVDSAILCKFATFAIGEDEIATMLSGALGMNFRAEDVLRIGGKIYDLEHEMNKIFGFTREDDDLPERFFNENNPIPRKEFLRVLDEYYKLRGWTDQ